MKKFNSQQNIFISILPCFFNCALLSSISIFQIMTSSNQQQSYSQGSYVTINILFALGLAFATYKIITTPRFSMTQYILQSQFKTTILYESIVLITTLIPFTLMYVLHWTQIFIIPNLIFTTLFNAYFLSQGLSQIKKAHS